MADLSSEEVIHFSINNVFTSYYFKQRQARLINGVIIHADGQYLIKFRHLAAAMSTSNRAWLFVKRKFYGQEERCYFRIVDSHIKF